MIAIVLVPGDRRKNLNIGHSTVEDLEVFVTTIEFKSNPTTVALQVDQNAMCEISLLVSTRATGLVNVIPHGKVAINPACITVKESMDMSLRRLFYINIVLFCNVDVHFPKLQKAGQVANTSDAIVHVNDERYSCLSGAHPHDIGTLVSTVHYMSSTARLEQMAKHEAL